MPLLLLDGDDLQSINICIEWMNKYNVCAQINKKMLEIPYVIKLFFPMSSVFDGISYSDRHFSI